MPKVKKEKDPEGIRGWLAVIGVMSVLGLLVSPFAIWLLFVGYGTMTEAAGGPLPGLLALSVFEGVAVVIATLLQVWFLVLFFKKKKEVPTLFIWLSIAGLAFSVCDMFLQAKWNQTEGLAYFDTTYLTQLDTAGLQSFVVSLVIQGVLVAYFLKSRRVKATFVH